MPEPSLSSPTDSTIFGDGGSAATYMEAATSIARTEGEVVGSVRKPLQIGFYLSIGWVALVAFMAAFAELLPFVKDPEAINTAFKAAPSTEYWFGTDNIGRDIFARTVYGGRMSLLIAGVAIVLGLIVGGFFGLVSGYFGRRTDRVISWGTDVLLAFPALVLTLALVGVLGERPWFADKRAWLVIATLSILSIAPLTRIVRASTLVYAQRDFVTAARSLGAKNRRILVREVLPNVVPSMVTFALTGVAVLIIAEGALAFLGQSVKAPTPTWGLLINEGRQNLEDAPWISLMPAAVMFLTILGFNIIGDVVSKRFDIKESLI
jgi:peptide/nickel transport system permease protein